MSDASSWLHKICATPEEKDARLVYADWLLEEGDPRGQFIAQQCALEELSGLEPEYSELLASTNRLEMTHASTWLAGYLRKTNSEKGLDLQAACDWIRPVFRHGFLHRFSGQYSEARAHWDWLREREPVQGMELVVGEGIPEEYRQLSPPSPWSTLKVRPQGWFTSNSVGDVLRWGFPELRELDLSGCSLGEDGCRLLMNLSTDMPEIFDNWTAPPPLPVDKLTQLVLQACVIGDEGAQILFGKDTWQSLEHLNLNQCKLQEEKTMKALAKTRWPALRHLFVWGNKGLGGKLRLLAKWPSLPRLQSLFLPQSTTHTDMISLFPAPSESLTRLGLSGAKELMKSPFAVQNAAERLRDLDVSGTRLGDASWQEILAMPCVETVVSLGAGGCSLSDTAIEDLVESDLKSLVTLDLSSNKLTDAGVGLLAQWPGLKHVTHLRLDNNRKLSNAGYEALIGSPYFEPTHLGLGKAGSPELHTTLYERYPGLRIGNG